MNGHQRRKGERGQLAGAEAIPFGVLIFVTGTLLAVNVWAVVDLRGVVDASARNYLREYTSATTPEHAAARGAASAIATAESHGVSADALTISRPEGVFGPCEIIEVTISVRHQALRLPFVGAIGESTTSTTQRELMQPFATPAPPDRPTPLAGTRCES